MKKFLFILTLFHFTCLHAQFTRFRHLQVDDGLSQNSVYCFAQDSLGFMWIGTSEGLNRYNGSSIKVYKYDPLDTSSLSDNSIRCLLVKGKKLWIGTGGGGINCMDLVTGKIKKFFHDRKKKYSIVGDFIYCIHEYEGKFYIATSDGGAGVFDPVTEKCVPLKTVSGTSMRDICTDKTGNLWFASWNGGVTMFNPKTNDVKVYRADGSRQTLLQDRTRAIYADSRGWIWVSCWSAGFNVIEPSSGNVYSSHDTSGFMKNLHTGLISQFLEDNNGNMWLCTAENGAVKYNPDTGEKEDFLNDVNDVYSISDNTVFSVYEDKSRIVWLGTWRGGVNIYDPKTYRFGWFRKKFNDPFSLINNNIYSFKLSNTGEIWIGTADRVCIFDPKTKKFTSLKTDSTDRQALKASSTIYSIEEDADGKMWFGTSGGGLYSYDPLTEKFRLYLPNANIHSLSSSSPSDMVLDHHRTLFIGTYGGGLNRYNPLTDDFTHYVTDSFNDNSISGMIVSNLLTRADGKIWVGTADGGLNLFDPDKGTFKHYLKNPKDSNSLIENSISSLCLDHHNRLWVGTSSGLCMYDSRSDKFIAFSRMHEFLKQEIVSIVEDNEGHLWITARRGLCRFNPNDNTFRFYDVSDGLQSNEFTYHAYTTTPDGKIYLGGFNGFNCFSPADIKDNQVVPAAVITDFLVLNKPYPLPQDIAYTKKITLRYSDYFFSFRFAAPEFSNTKKNFFKYKLEGFNTSWVEIGNSNSVTFTNLDPGEYTLKVVASNNSGLWNETPTELKIIITPPFWRTKWFYTLCVILVVFSVYLYIRWREKKLVEEKFVLENKVQQRTLELRVEKEKVEAANKDIRDSINYAKKIQTAILPQDEQFSTLLPRSFVLFKPKDIVSGDFYWISEVAGSGFIFYAAADCTGHGVPGGFMTMLGTSLLNEIVNEKNIMEPAEILNRLREKIIVSLRQGTSGESKDGMDMVLVRISPGKNKLIYAAANNSLYLVRDKQIKEYKPDKQPIGFYGEEKKPFTQHELQLREGDVIYTFTDGYADQFGGLKGKKFKYKQLEELLLSIHLKPMQEQKSLLNTAIENWKDGYDQVDDILVIGVSV